MAASPSNAWDNTNAQMKNPSNSTPPEGTVHSSEVFQGTRAQALVEEAFRLVWDTGVAYVLPMSRPVIWMEQNEITTGVLIYSSGPEDPFIWIDLVFVRPECRQQGICTLLLRKLLERAAETGMRHVACEVQNENLGMMQSLRQLGFGFEPADDAFLLASLLLLPDGQVDQSR